MRLTTLTLSNFKRHRELHLDFHPGSNAIMGPNYSGKSTILEAILVLLWGNKGASVPADQLSSDDAKGFEVTGIFSNGWVIKRTSRDSYITRGMDTFVRGHTAVNAAVEEYLGMDRNTFLKVFASKQGSPQQILEMEGAELQRFIESCIQLETLDAIVKESNRQASNTKAGMLAYEAQLQSPDVFEATQKELLENREHFDAVTSSISVNDRAIIDLQAKRDQLQKDVLHAINHNKLVDAYARALATVEHYGDISEPILQGTERIEETIDNLNQISHQWKLVAASEATFNKLKNELEKVQSTIPARPESLRDVSFLDADAELIAGVIKEKSEAIKTLKDLIQGAKCPTCKRSYELSDAEIAQMEADVALHQGELPSLAQQREATNLMYKECVQHNLLQDKRSRAWDLYEGQLADAKRRLAEFTHAAIPEVAEEEVAGLLANAKSELSTLLRANSDARATWDGYLRDKAKLDDLANPGPGVACEQIHLELQGVTKALDDTTAMMQADQRLLGTIKGVIASCESTIKHHQQALELVQEKSSHLQKLKNISSALSDNRSKIVSDAMTTVLSAASDFVATCTDGDISEVMLHDGSLAYREGERIRYKGSASGAQKTLMGVGMKLGLARLVRTPFEGLLLDEVSADMDDEISMRCMLALSSFGQSIFVSHRQMDVADQVIMLDR